MPSSSIISSISAGRKPGYAQVNLEQKQLVVDVGFGYRLAGLVVQRGYIQSYGVCGVGYGAKAQHEHNREDTSEFLYFDFSFLCFLIMKKEPCGSYS